MADKEEKRRIFSGFVPSKYCPSEKRLWSLALRQLEWALAEGRASVPELLKVLSMSEDKGEDPGFVLPEGWRIEAADGG